MGLRRRSVAEVSLCLTLTMQLMNFFIIHSLATQRRYLTVGQSMSSCMDGKLHVFQYGTGKTHTEQVSAEYAQVHRLLAASTRRRGVTVATVAPHIKKKRETVASQLTLHT